MTSDARHGAWLAAWDRLEAVDKLRAVRKDAGIEATPEAYWLLLAQASIYAQLAKAPTDVGFCVGDWLERRASEERDQRERLEKLLAERRGGES